MKSDVECILDEGRLRPQNSEVQRLWCDNSKIQSLTGFKPEITIEEGLKKTVDWILEPKNLKTYKTEIYNI